MDEIRAVKMGRGQFYTVMDGGREIGWIKRRSAIRWFHQLAQFFFTDAGEAFDDLMRQLGVQGQTWKEAVERGKERKA